jgi:hypothetical protein
MLHLNNNDAKAVRAQPSYDPLFKIQPIIDTLVTKFQYAYTTDEKAYYRRGNMPISRAYIISCVYQRKAPQSYESSTKEKGNDIEHTTTHQNNRKQQ